MTEAAPPPAVDPEPAATSPGDGAWMPPVVAPRNPYARRGFIYSLVSIGVNPLGFLSIIAIVLGARGMRNAPRFADPDNARRLGRRAVTIGIITLVVFIVLAAVAIPVFIARSHSGPVYSQALLQNSITKAVEQQGVSGTIVTTCPGTASTTVGSVIRCDVAFQGTTVPIYATITDASGKISLSTIAP